MAQDDEGVFAWLVLAVTKRTPGLWRNPKHTKPVRGDRRPCQANRSVDAAEIEIGAVRVRGHLHAAAAIAHHDERTLRIVIGRANEAIRIGERQWTKKNAVDQAEDGGVSADAQRKSQDSHGCETEVLAQRPQRKGEVLEQRFQ